MTSAKKKLFKCLTDSFMSKAIITRKVSLYILSVGVQHQVQSSLYQMLLIQKSKRNYPFYCSTVKLNHETHKSTSRQCEISEREGRDGEGETGNGGGKGFSPSSQKLQALGLLKTTVTGHVFSANTNMRITVHD